MCIRDRPSGETGEFYEVIRKASAKGKTVVVTTQVQNEGSDLSIYNVCLLYTYRVTATPRWRRANGSAGINSSTAISSADGRRCALLVQLLDSRHAPSADDEMMLEYLAHHEVSFIEMCIRDRWKS